LVEKEDTEWAWRYA